MKEASYGAFQQAQITDPIDLYLEEIFINGFTVITDLFSQEELEIWRSKIDVIYQKQESDFGRSALSNIQDLDMCRAPIVYDFDFIKLATHKKILPIVERILGSWYILNLQNSIINRPDIQHHQRSWHRDLPYQNFVISQPLAINALIAIDEFSPETGGTQVVPYTHKMEVLPSDSFIKKNTITANMPAGSAVVFDSMLFHRAGANQSKKIRRGVNHIYTKPIIKQQYDFPRALAHHKGLDPFSLQLLGFTSQVPIDDKEWRQARSVKMSNK